MKDLTKLFDDVEVTEVVPIEDGAYEGKITDVERHNEKYDYTRYTVTFKHNNVDRSLVVSYPTGLSFTKDGKPSTQHAKFLTRMGFVYTENFKEFVPELVGKPVKFLVHNKGEYSEIVKDSVKLL